MRDNINPELRLEIWEQREAFRAHVFDSWVCQSTTVLRVFTKSDWSNAGVEAVKTKGSVAGPAVAMYLALKGISAIAITGACR